MPPKRRPAAAPSTAPSKPPPRSKLAKEHNITAQTETEIREAFNLFATSSAPPYLPSPSLRSVLTALGVPPSSASELRSLLETVDPTSSGEIEYEHLVAVAALKLANRSEDSQKEEVDAAFGLFVGGKGKGTGEGRISIEMLRRVARELKMEGEVGEGVLKDMILEANGGAGVGMGVGRQEFEGVMRRAGGFR